MPARTTEDVTAIVRMFERVAPFSEEVVRVAGLFELVGNERVARANGQPIAIALAPHRAPGEELLARGRAHGRRVVTVEVHALFDKVSANVWKELRIHFLVGRQAGSEIRVLHVGRGVRGVDRELPHSQSSPLMRMMLGLSPNWNRRGGGGLGGGDKGGGDEGGDEGTGEGGGGGVAAPGGHGGGGVGGGGVGGGGEGGGGVGGGGVGGGGVGGGGEGGGGTAVAASAAAAWGVGATARAAAVR